MKLLRRQEGDKVIGFYMGFLLVNFSCVSTGEMRERGGGGEGRGEIRELVYVLIIGRTVRMIYLSGKRRSDD